MADFFKKGDTGWFQKDRFGMFIHWGIYALPARQAWIRYKDRIKIEDYKKYFDHFYPDLYDPKEWARTAKKAGMKYLVITTKHHDGFCLWDSKYTDYKATNTPYGKDVLKPMIEAFRNEGLRVGFYYSLIDWHHHEFPIDALHPQRDDKAFRKQEKHRDITKYAEYMRNQVRELLTDFGKIDIVWFDFSYPIENGKGRDDWESEKLYKLVRELQPEIIINDRLDLPGSADITTPEQYIPSEGLMDDNGNPIVWEGCQTFSGTWGYNRDEESWKSVQMLIEMLINHVSRDGNLLLNVGPTGRGEFDYRAIHCLKGIGEWMKGHSRAIYGCKNPPAEFKAPQDCRYTWNPETKRLFLHIFAWPFRTIHLEGLDGRVKYAQVLNDGSEIKFSTSENTVNSGMSEKSKDCAVTLTLPVKKPNVDVPVVELFID
ncbi:MAG: alpha-L-fucosidase [Lentisphaerae bacterium]|nr:alpha-L-fucosidase [Lentisphaerota bacterium]